MRLARRHFLHLAAGAAALSVASRVASAQAYPARAVRIVAQIPEVWLSESGSDDDAARRRRAYERYLTERLTPPRPFLEEAARAR